MADYNAVPQGDAEVASNASDESHRSPQQTHGTTQAFKPLSIDFDNLGGESFMNNAKVDNDDKKKPSSVLSLQSRLGRSRATSSSYDIVEDDDYNEIGATEDWPGGTKGDLRRSQTKDRTTYNDTSDYHHPSHESTRRASPDQHSQRPSSNGSVPLAHPTPGLQSLQGAYVGNVERLEMTAERFDMSGNEEGSQPSAREQHSRPMSSRSRGVSAGSRSSSVMKGDDAAVRTSVYSQGSGFVSPRQSVLSSPTSQPISKPRSGSVASRLARVVEPQNEDQEIQHYEQSTGPSSVPADQPSSSHHHAPDQGAPSPQEIPEERPASAGSTDTYRQSTNLFQDFDGVHFTPHPSHSAQPRRISLSKPPLASHAEPHDKPTPGQNMVYYPAPVPMVLNLPQRLSRKPPVDPDLEKRRTQVIDSMAPDARKSAAWLPNSDQEDAAAPPRDSNRLSHLPPQMRASAFFDPPPPPLDIQVKQQSAVATLDSILDASANAPVHAFTNHPIVGQTGGGVYGGKKVKKKDAENKQKHRSHVTLPGARESVAPSLNHIRTVSEELYDDNKEGHGAATNDETTPFRTSYGQDGYAEHGFEPGRQSAGGRRSSGDGDGDEDGDEDDQRDPDFARNEGDDEGGQDETPAGPPTTLLAELQMRQTEQKQRNRTAATAFPNGMHSTLLELDAVAQRQRKTRNQKHVTLAWEDPDFSGRRSPDDEDVPLAVLFPDSNKEAEEQRPLGLMEQLQLDENEPLSHRRARIRGEDPVAARRPTPSKRDSTAYTLDIPALEEDNSDDDDDDETLAQRLNRLKAREEGGTTERRNSLFARELLSKFQPESEKAKEQHAEPEEEEETLGQRRKRLQAETARNNNNNKGGGIAAPHTMANILHVHQANYPPGDRPQQVPSGPPHRYSGNPMSGAGMYGPPPVPTGYPMTNNVPYNTPYSHANATPYGNGMSSVNLAYYPNDAANRMSYARGRAQAEQPETIDPKQRAMIDRWRLSVR